MAIFNTNYSPFPVSTSPQFEIDDTLTLSEDNVLGVAMPTKGVTQAEYDALTEQQKNGLIVVDNSKLMFNGEEIVLSGGSAASGDSLPIGSILIWSGSQDNIPSGWALCDGTNGTPDLRDRFVLGAGNAHTIGETGGSETVTLTTSNLPAHYHTIYLYNINSSSSPAKIALAVDSYAGNSINQWRLAKNSNDGYATHQWNGSYETSSVGSNSPHNNMPPYYTLCYIMKISGSSGGSSGTANLEFLTTNDILEIMGAIT